MPKGFCSLSWSPCHCAGAFTISDLPESLDKLLSSSSASIDDSWAAFIAEFSRLLLHVAHSVSSSGDDALDAYAYVLDQLRKDGCKRLRSYAADPESKFTTWLVVVSRRACVDFHRTRYGGDRARDSADAKDRRSLRRNLQELNALPEELAFVPDDTGSPADRQLLDEELTRSLQAALDSLTPSDRLLLALRFEEDLSAAEIAKILLLPSPFHVYRRLNGILGRLRISLREKGFESSLV